MADDFWYRLDLPTSDWVTGDFWVKEAIDVESYPGPIIPGPTLYPGMTGGIWRELVPYYNDDGVWRSW